MACTDAHFMAPVVITTFIILSYNTSQWAMMPFGWEGNCRSDVALATRHRHKWFSTYGFKALKREMSTHLRSVSGIW